MKTEIRPRVHGNGFIQLDLSESVRLHVFGDERIPKQKVSTQIHDHTFGFTSRILSGILEQISYEVTDDENGDFKVYRAFTRDRQDTVLGDTGRRVVVKVSSTKILHAGDSYSMLPEEWHESKPRGRVVTIITKNGLSLSQGGRSPNILVPVGQEPDNEFSRYALSELELWNIITSDQAELEKAKQLRSNEFGEEAFKLYKTACDDRMVLAQELEKVKGNLANDLCRLEQELAKVQKSHGELVIALQMVKRGCEVGSVAFVVCNDALDKAEQALRDSEKGKQ